MTSTLSAFAFLGEQSFATPGAWNSPLSIISANIAAINADVGAISGVTITPPSGNTIQMPSDLSISGYLSVGKGASIGTVGPTIPEPVALTIGVNSGVSDYIYFNDTSNLRSDYLLGSHAGGTADGLNIFDVSGNTMIVSFSKQSVRFYQQVVGPVFDVGGALASTLNAATFLGSGSTLSAIQAAISAATLATPPIKRVYLPASMYPFSATSMVFDTGVQMVREGGDWNVYDCTAYGVFGGNDAAAIQAAGNGAAANKGVCYFPPGTYSVNTTVSFATITDTVFQGPGGNAALVSMGADGVTLLNFTGVCSRIIIRDLWLGSLNTVFTTGGGINITGPVGTKSDTIQIHGITLQNLPNPMILSCINVGIVRTIRAFNNKVNATPNPIVSLNTVISTTFDDYLAFCSGVSFGSDGFVVGGDCDTIIVTNSQQLHATGKGFVCQNLGGGGTGNGPRLTRFTDCYAELNTGAGFEVDAARDVRLNGCNATSNGGAGFAITAGESVAITDSYGHLNGQQGIVVTGGDAVRLEGNCLTSSGQNTNNTFDGIQIGTGVIGAIVVNNRCGDFIFNVTNKTRYGLSLGASTDSLTVIGNDLRQNQTGSLLNSSTGSQNLILDSSFVTTSATNALAFGGALSVPAGTAVLPSLAFLSERSLGWYRSAASTLANSYGTLAVTGFLSVITLDTTASSIDVVSGMRFKGLASNDLKLTPSADNGSAEVFGTNAADSVVVWRVNNDGSSVFANLTTTNSAAIGSVLRTGDGTSGAPAYAYTSETTLGLYRSGVDTIAQSQGTFNLATNAVRLSMRTIAASALTTSAANTNVAVNECVFTVSASGASFAINSGGTTWVFNSDASAKNT